MTFETSPPLPRGASYNEGNENRDNENTENVGNGRVEQGSRNIAPGFSGKHNSGRYSRRKNAEKIEFDDQILRNR